MTGREIVEDDWHRCFIALVPDVATRDALAAMPVGAAARRVSVDQLHMTLAFLGTVPPATGARLAAQLASVVAPLAEQRAEPVETWPSAAHPRLVVVPFSAAEGLAGFERRVRALVAGFGLPIDDHRPFRPHITLARYARSVQPAREPALGRPCSSPPAATLAVTPRFDTLTLYSSTLARHGARYKALASVAVPAA
ncbi:RNA 2',3'-cyclic phosphodiesterase [Trinickia soli]|uniref:RNA 2',3'-cyclic phosphodiesterase n=1 Tax=Trinickia soli TaxID=380675 RepID=A0A2N7VYU2_9BURK|nr:RNA 2',3'-cyclic phosphodiesterase [Trinickia soli]KAA0088160.1 RNA 2',3'-cyclic phosphodiesterase [Paraburkholderia sp. T12-10]PMS22316.1 RNA 2',3'-cyclic phosphodiesterase [Trinickia soli]CAB3704900.1 RNA 2',3'-cyclic phosphodiesterase [Trinickia soli]